MTCGSGKYDVLLIPQSWYSSMRTLKKKKHVISLLPIKFHQIPMFLPHGSGGIMGYHIYISWGYSMQRTSKSGGFAPVKVVSSPPPLPLHWASLWGTLEVSSRDKHPWEWMDIIGYPKIGWENIQRLPSRMGWPTKLLSSKLRWRMENGE